VTGRVYCIAVRVQSLDVIQLDVYYMSRAMAQCDERFEVAKVALAHVFLRVFPFCPVCTILPVLCNHLHIRRSNGRNLKTFKNAMLFR